MISGASPGSILASAFLHGYIPVNMAYLLGVDVADVAYPFVNMMPFLASESMFGVEMVVLPYALTSPSPRSSATIRIMLGFCGPSFPQAARTVPARGMNMRDLFICENRISLKI